MSRYQSRLFLLTFIFVFLLMPLPSSASELHPIPDNYVTLPPLDELMETRFFELVNESLALSAEERP